MKGKVLFLVNHDLVIYNFRKEIVQRLIQENFEVYISSPNGKRIPELIEMGAHFVEANMDRHGKSILSELKLLNYYKKIIREIQPSIIFGFTIKPNIWGAIAARKYDIPFVANITGLGSAVENPGFLQKITVLLYKYSFSKIQTVFFQNKENQQFFIDNKIAIGKHKLLPGSGVNLTEFIPLEYPNDDTIEFVFISRIMKEKGVDQYLEAARDIKARYPNTHFHICGFCEEAYEDKLQEYEDRGIIIYHGMLDDIRHILKDTHCTIHPSFHEGLSNILLETAASARPILASRIAGCIETFEEGISGLSFEPRNTLSLVESIEKFLSLTNTDRKEMGIKGRTKMEKQFNREIVINRYLNEVIGEKNNEFI